MSPKAPNAARLRPVGDTNHPESGGIEPTPLIVPKDRRRTRPPKELLAFAQRRMYDLIDAVYAGTVPPHTGRDVAVILNHAVNLARVQDAVLETAAVREELEELRRELEGTR